MNFLKVNMNIVSYSTPIKKIVVALFILVLLVNRNRFFHFQLPLLKAVDVLVAFLLVILCVFCIYISIAELLIVRDNRTAIVAKQTDIICLTSKAYHIEFALDLIRNNEINDIVIILQNSTFRIGSSSDFRIQTGKFFDKRFYIEDVQYTDYEQFVIDFNKLIGDHELINVVSIDGVQQ